MRRSENEIGTAHMWKTHSAIANGQGFVAAGVGGEGVEETAVYDVTTWMHRGGYGGEYGAGNDDGG